MESSLKSKGMSLIVKTITRIISPLILVLAVYTVLHGQITHGGGFQAGVLVSCSLLLLILAYSLDFVEEVVSFKLSEVVRSLGVLTIIIVALTGMIFGGALFKNVGVYPYGFPGQIFSGGNLILHNLGEMFNVSLCFLIAFYFLIREKRREKP